MREGHVSHLCDALAIFSFVFSSLVPHTARLSCLLRLSSLFPDIAHGPSLVLCLSLHFLWDFHSPSIRSVMGLVGWLGGPGPQHSTDSVSLLVILAVTSQLVVTCWAPTHFVSCGILVVILYLCQSPQVARCLVINSPTLLTKIPPLSVLEFRPLQLSLLAH
jgi:hypothetical protein